MKMKNKLAELNILRNSVATRKEHAELAQKTLEETLQYKATQQAKELYMEAKVEADELADAIREESTKKFLSTFPPKDRNTKPYDGIQIKEFKTIKVTDERKAITWAVESEQFNLVLLAKSQFNKVARVLDLDFVTKDKEYRAQIASDLSMYEDTEDD